MQFEYNKKLGPNAKISSLHAKCMQYYDAMYAAIHAQVGQTACVLTYPYSSHYMPTYMSMYANKHAVV